MTVQPETIGKLVDLLCKVPQLKLQDGRTAWLIKCLPSNAYQYLERNLICDIDVTYIISGIKDLILANKAWSLLLLIDKAIEYSEPLDIYNQLRDIRRTVALELTGASEADATLSVRPDLSFAEIVIGKDEKKQVSFLSMGALAALSVAKVKVMTASGLSYNGTGWLIAPGVIITNHHVIAARRIGDPSLTDDEIKIRGQNCRFIFDFEEGKSCHEFESMGLLDCDADLDYAILRVKAVAKDGHKSIQDYGFLHIVPFYPTLDQGLRLNVIQHPDGRLKEVALRTNYYVGENTPAQRIYYLTDTEGGSSGSPVMNDDWQVVALHRGWSEFNQFFRGQPIRFKNLGLDYNSLIMPDETVTKVNEGVKIHAIFKNFDTPLRQEIQSVQHIQIV